MGNTEAQKAQQQVLPPRATGQNLVQSVVTGAAAVSTALWGGLSAADVPDGKVYVTFEALTTNCYIRLRSDAGAAGTTANNGLVIVAGTKERLWLNPAVDVRVDHLATGAGVLKWYISSPEYAGTKAHGT